ncbi:MAG: hypothetical protein JRF59_01525 [Deltaproteobacteria bacterium]|nr:hypothetical protein [Deltaproteobacteria bacterium]MBW1922261.1 hypothetical protein [Deltaproteobacteria bacterium]MBW1949536.1 hypothetical protein [Deltaproteobacteria bacterium]MBW2008413.1 hypothetical protein [Deltaproteobacteria bacterium]MBW2102175.1 hypothetical protein [Deltaproteobacteria bacterium]
MILRETGKYFITLLGCCIREDTEPERFFDQFYEIWDFQELWTLLADSCPACIHAFIQPWILGALAVAAKEKSGTYTIIDSNDAMLFLHNDPNHPDISMEEAILRQADGFTHKMPPEAIAVLRQKYEKAPPDYAVQSLPLPQLFRDRTPNGSTRNRLVFAGGVIPPRLADSLGHGNHLFDPMIASTENTGLHLDILVNQNARDMHWEEHRHYQRMEKRYPCFSFKPGVPFHQLPDILTNYHFGLLFDNLARAQYPEEHFRFTMPTKVCSYFEAGLPLLVYEEFTTVRKLVNEHGLGLVYSLRRLEEIPALIAAADYQGLRDNVREYRQTHSMNAMIPILGEAYEPTS